MVLKKPYAFLIKHFRAIHLLLLIPMIYLIIKTRAIVGFLSSYIASDYSLNFSTVLSSLSSNYINILMYVSVIVILVVFIAMSILLQKKEKPTKFYNISIVYYIIIFLLITASYKVFAGIEADTLEDVAVRLIRDVGYMIHYSQYLFVIFTFIRGIGFNLRKFNFKSDIQELEISSEDSEEFEFLVGRDTYETKRTIRRFFRELRYYYLENKFIFTVITVIAVIVIGTLIYMNREVYQKVYKENENFSFGYLNLKIKDSYISNLSNNGKEIKKNKTYMIIKLQITNRYREDIEFNYGNLGLIVNKKVIQPDLSVASYFTDFGNPYNGTLVKGLTNNEYILVYEMDSALTNAKFSLAAYSHYDSTPGGLGAVNKEVNIKPKRISSKVVTNNVGKGTNINLSTTNLKKTMAAIMNYELTNRYEYQICSNETNCVQNAIYIDYSKDHNKTLLVLDYDLAIDDESTYFSSNKDYKSFFEDFLEIKYTYNRKEYKTKIKLLNPENYSDKLIMKVPSEVNYAESIEAVITVRNVSYNIKLK